LLTLALVFASCGSPASPGPAAYTITFDSHGGSAVDAVTEFEGTAVPKPADPARGGFTFTGWFSAEPGGPADAWPHILTGTVTMHARWTPGTPTQYTITFDTHGGSAVAAVKADAGTQVPKPNDPTQDGFAFAGWFSAETGGVLHTWPHTLTANLTMHARWAPLYTVTFDANGGTPVPAQTVAAGEKADQPVPVTNVPVLLSEEGLYLDPKFIFDGWYDATYTAKYDFTVPVTGNLDLYAKWTDPSPVDLSAETGAHVLEKALNYITTDYSGITEYTILLVGNYSMEGVYAANIDKEHAVVTLAGKVPVEIGLSSDGSLFYISAGELVLDENVTLKGIASNNGALVFVNGASPSLRMKAGVKITGNTTSFSIGGGVQVGSGSFTMEGGEISGNSSWRGGGVAVYDSSFSKTGGLIYGDTNNTFGDGNLTDNTATSGNTGGGHAVFYTVYADSLTEYYRDATLYAGDDIDTDTLPTEVGPANTVGNWIMKDEE
jgi:uncharacterized repeat protein (TIGR02543 family)